MKEFLGKYDLHHETVGKGAKGMIKKAYLKANREPRAVKIIDKLELDQAERTRLANEIEILKQLVHPNIVRLYEVYENKSKIYMVTELCDGCELFEEIS